MKNCMFKDETKNKHWGHLGTQCMKSAAIYQSL